MGNVHRSPSPRARAGTRLGESDTPGAIAALAIGPLVQLGAEWARNTGALAAHWEPGLLGASIGALALVAASRGSAKLPAGETAW